MLLMAHKANQPLHTLNVFLICLVALYVIVYAACIPYLFSRACAVTEALRDVQRGIHLLRSDVFFFDQVKNVVVSSGGGGDAQAAATCQVPAGREVLQVSSELEGRRGVPKKGEAVHPLIPHLQVRV